MIFGWGRTFHRKEKIKNRKIDRLDTNLKLKEHQKYPENLKGE